jgi:hypothetical protein
VKWNGKMTKEKFWQDLEEIINDPLFIGSTDDEINNNLWSISLGSELANAILLKDFSRFIKRVISNRKEQVKILNPTTNILFYLWFDDRASQLKFNIISDNGTGLPFKCKVILCDNYTPILKDFLEHPYHDGIPLEMLTDVNSGEHCEEEYEVYCTEL